MKKKTMAAISAATVIMTASLFGCGKDTNEDVIVRDTVPETVQSCQCQCTCGNCICSGRTAGDITSQTQEESIQEESTLKESVQETQESAESEQIEETVIPETEQNTQELNEIERLTAGELAARKEQQKNFAAARESLYLLKNSKDKTQKINQMDKQILANNAYDFSSRNIVFIGDSITEGITSAVDANGNFVSYVTYANSYLHFNNVLNHGKGGRMFTPYADEELSLAMNFGNVTNVNSDIIVVFAGINDYLSVTENKRFGDVNDKMSTAGYCGSLRYFMKQLKEYYGDRDIFFVTMYNTAKTSSAVYSDTQGKSPSLGDYMQAERTLAKEFGFNIIELYDIGFMDCTDSESADYYLRDGLHPKDNGNIVLGEHIAAELSYYFSQKESN